MSDTQATTFIRPHISISVGDLTKSIAFYEALFGTAPVKRREGYAKFSLTTPPLNLALNERGEKAKAVEDGVSHFGVEVPDTKDVSNWRARVTGAGTEVLDEEGVSCCYAKQDKFWVQDPEGRRWEVFTVLEATDDYAPTFEKEDAKSESRDCCAPTCCT